MSFKSSVLVLILLVCSVGVSYVEAREIKGSATIEYRRFSSSKVKAEALEAAKLDVWKQYVAGFSRARLSVYHSDLEKEFLDNIDQYLSNVVIETSRRDKDSNRFSMAIRANINDALVDEMFRRNSDVATTDYQDMSDFGSLFLARIQMSQRTFDDRKVLISRSESSSVTDQTLNSSETGAVDAVHTKDMRVRETGGSTTTRRAESSYEVSEDYNSSLADIVSERLEDAGYSPMEYEELTDCGAPFFDEVLDEFKSNAKMSSRMIKDIRISAVECGWTYFGMGEVTLSGHRSDGATGLRAVDANVSYKVWSIEDGRARRVASVRNKTFTAMHANERSAEEEAIIKAADYAMGTVVAKLQAKRVR